MLLKYPYFYDIVLSDFGRAAAVEYVQAVCDLEQKTIQRHFLSKDTAFYDEYRRIMFAVIADLAYFKNRQIDAAVAKGKIDSDILIGFKGQPMPDDIRDRISAAVLEQVYLALNRGYQNIRIVIPCNTISELGHHIYSLATNPEKFSSILTEQAGISPSSPVFSLLAGAKFSLYSPPTLVIDEVRKTRKGKVTMLVFGTPLTVGIYQKHVSKLGLGDWLTVPALAPDEQELVNQWIELSIAVDAALLDKLKEKIRSSIILPRQKDAGELVAIEACTDIRLGLGINSLDVLVARSVNDAYGLDGSKL